MSLQYSPSEVQGIKDAFNIRYVTVASAVMLLYDHILTITDEYKYVWRAPHSITKDGFLLIRYLVPIVMVVTLHEMCGFNGFSYSDRECKLLYSVTVSSATASCITANIIILHRVLDLWKDSKRTQIWLQSVLAASACVYITLTIIIVQGAWPYSFWSPVVKMCSTTAVPSLFPVLWGAPLFFEFSTIIFVVYSTLATPRSATFPFKRSLQKNGIVFFLFVIFVRLVTVVLFVTARKPLSMGMLYVVWMAVIIFFNHSFIRLQKAELRNLQLSIFFSE